MEKRIQLEKRGRNPNQIQELNLDNCRSTNIVGLTDEFTALESLSLINVGLTTLKGFPKLPNLKKLELSDNRISNGLNYLTTSPKLTNLNLSGNKIKDLETLKPLENFQNLEVLDLFNNEATSVENYREKIFAMIPSLKYLDGFDADEVEAPSDGDHDSEDDDGATNSFCINGLEIDLAELEDFEKRLSEKRNRCVQNVPDPNEPDDLDELLEKLKIQEAITNADSDEKQSSPTNAVINSAIANEACNSGNTRQVLQNPIRTFTKKDEPVDTERENSDSGQIEQAQQRPINIPLMMFGLMFILSFVNYVAFSDEGDEDDEVDDDDDDEDDDSDEEDNGDVSLAEVYNEDLEEDNSDWGEENEAEEEDDDPDTDSEAEEGGDETAKEENQTEAEVPDDSQARGKKRKHEG